MHKEGDFTTGPILPKLLRFTLPILAALFLQALYGAVDLWAVGRFGTAADMSAVSSGSQAMLVVTGFVTGLCMGITVLMGRCLGQGDHARAGDILGASLWLLGGVAAAVTVPLVLFAPELARWVHAPAEALHQTELYLRICGGGTVFIAAYNGFSSIFRGMGNSRTPLVFVGLACLVNIAGDLLLIRGFHLGAAGAAIATIAAQAVSAAASLLYVRRRGFPFPVSRRSLAFHRETAGEICALGLPIALSDTCNEICYLLIIGFANQLGLIVSAGVGAAEKIIVFLLLVPMAFLSAISSFVAQNMGAGEQKRAVRALRQGMAAACGLGLVLAYVLAFHGDLLSRLFARDAEVAAASAVFLRATALECLILSAANCFVGYFNGLGKTGFVMAQGLFAIFLVKIPYAWLALHVLDHKLFQIGLSTVWGALFSLTVCAAAFFCGQRREERRLRQCGQGSGLSPEDRRKPGVKM